jgi:hypothetical protein
MIYDVREQLDTGAEKSICIYFGNDDESLSRDDHAAPTFSIKDGEEEVLIRLSDIENLIKALNRLKELTSV